MPALRQPQRVSREESLWIPGSLCRFRRISFEPLLFLQRHPPSPQDGHFSPADLCLAASELGFETDARTVKERADFSSIALPCLVFFPCADACGPENEPQPIGMQAATATPALIAEVDTDQVSDFQPGHDAPLTCGKAQILQDGAGQCWVPPPVRAAERRGRYQGAGYPTLRIHLSCSQNSQASQGLARHSCRLTSLAAGRPSDAAVHAGRDRQSGGASGAKHAGGRRRRTSAFDCVFQRLFLGAAILGATDPRARQPGVSPSAQAAHGGISFRYGKELPWLYIDLSFSFKPRKTNQAVIPDQLTVMLEKNI